MNCLLMSVLGARPQEDMQATRIALQLYADISDQLLALGRWKLDTRAMYRQSKKSEAKHSI